MVSILSSKLEVSSIGFKRYCSMPYSLLSFSDGGKCLLSLCYLCHSLSGLNVVSHMTSSTTASSTALLVTGKVTKTDTTYKDDNMDIKNHNR